MDSTRSRAGPSLDEAAGAETTAGRARVDEEGLSAPVEERKSKRSESRLKTDERIGTGERRPQCPSYEVEEEEEEE